MTIHSVLKAFRRVHSPIVFAGIAFAFFLPFATVSCNSAETTFTGVQLVTRTVPEGGIIDASEGEISDRVEQESSSLAAIILVLAAFGWVLGVLGVERGPGWVAGLGTFLTIMLSEESWSFGGPDVEFHIGYKLALSLFAWGCLVHAYRAIRRRGVQRHVTARPPI